MMKSRVLETYMVNITYSEDKKIALFDGYKFTLDAKTGYYLSTKPTHEGRRERLHVYVWRHFNGPVREGFHVHHKDEDKSNNEIENLVCTRGITHSKYHLLKYSTNHREKMAENLEKKVRPKASLWHGSKEGREWHSKHAKETVLRLMPKEFVCENCGKHFWKKPLGVNKYCCNACKTAARNKSGVDDETRICAYCGREFRANKYGEKKFCSKNCYHQFRRSKSNYSNGQTAGL